MVGPRLLRTHDGRRPTAAQPLSFPHRLRLIGVFGASLFFAPRPGTMSTGSGSPVPGPWKARRGNPPGDPATVQGRPALEVFPAGTGAGASAARLHPGERRPWAVRLTTTPKGRRPTVHPQRTDTRIMEGGPVGYSSTEKRTRSIIKASPDCTRGEDTWHTCPVWFTPLISKHRCSLRW